jgi:hypothetical protein
MDDPIEVIRGRDESFGRVLGQYDTPPTCGAGYN